MYEICAKTLQKVIIFSDGCSSQYKSKVPFAYLQQLPNKLGVDMERGFFGARHGKNLCDALGEVIKTCARRAEKQKQCTGKC
jgi:hypothetical protein